MESTRQKKVARLLQKELGDLFLRESAIQYEKAFISVTVVRVSPDLSFAKVYLNIFGKADRDAIMEKIKVSSKDIRRKIGEAIRKQVRIIPEFAFYIDDSIDYANRIDELLKK
jgi:ribosome-binding factor A